MFSKFLRNESGATMVEYGVALILAIVIGGSGLVLLAGQVNANMADTAPTLQTR